MSAADLSVVIVNYNTAHLLDDCLGSLRAAGEGLDLQIIMIDNASRDNSLRLLRERHPDVELIVNATNVGFGRANNQALARATSPLVLLLNTDAFVAIDALANTLAFMTARPDIGIVGGRLIGRDGSLQPSCRYFPTLANQFAGRTGLWRYLKHLRMVDDMGWDHASARECDWVPGCFYMVRRKLIDSVGLFDARYFLYMEEVDHCHAAKRQGWKVAYFPGASVVHIGGESARSDAAVTTHGSQVPALQIESELLYFRKWQGRHGAALHLTLSLLAIGVTTLRNALRRRPQSWFRSQATTAATLMRLAARTGLGSRGTR